MSIVAKTNKIIAEINYVNLLNNFQIFKIKNSVKTKEYQKFYSKIFKEIKPLAHAVCKEYTIIACNVDFDIFPFQKKYEIRQLRIVEIKKEQIYLLVNLFNSLLAKRSNYFEIEGNVYDLYYIAERKSSKLTTIKISVNREMLLKIDTVNFIQTENKKDKDINRYVIRGDKLVKSNDSREDETYYKKGNYASKKTSFNFLGTDLKGYKSSKIFILNNYLKSLKSYFGDFITIRFEEIQMAISAYDTDTSIKKRKKIMQTDIIKTINAGGGIHIANLCNNNNEEIQELQRLITSYSKGQLSSTTSNNLEHKKMNITITFDKDYYKKKKEEDVYKKTKINRVITQNITNNVLKKINETLLHVLLKELVIKHELNTKKMILPKNNNKEKFIFVYPITKKSKVYDFIKIEIENSKIEFTELSSTELSKCQEIISGVYYPEVVEAIIFHQDDTNYIVNTSKFMLPDLQKIEEIRSEYEKQKNVNVDKLIAMLCNYTHLEGTEKIIKTINSKADIFTNTIDIKSIKINNREIRKNIENLFDVNMTFNLRRKEYQIIDPLIAIRFNEEHNLYTVGASGNINQNIIKANLIRQVRVYQRSKSLLKPIISMLDEYFVRNGQFTVLPFPIKYCREYSLQIL